MSEIQVNMGAMARVGKVRIGVMSANDKPGEENARLRVRSSEGSQTVKVLLGQTVTVDNIGAISLLELNLQKNTAPRGEPQPAGGSILIDFEPVDEEDDR